MHSTHHLQSCCPQLETVSDSVHLPWWSAQLPPLGARIPRRLAVWRTPAPAAGLDCSPRVPPRSLVPAPAVSMSADLLGLSLPDYLLAGGDELAWHRAHHTPLPSLIAPDEEQRASASEAEEEEVVAQEKTDETEAPAEADETMEPADDATSEEPQLAASKAILSPDALIEASTNDLLEDDELLQDAAPSAANEDLVEFEIVIDGEVVGSTFLPRRNEGDPSAKEQMTQAKANALKQQRKRKFEQRLGYLEDTGAAAASSAVADSVLPLPPAVCASCGLVQTKYKCPRCDTGSCSLACVTAHKTKLNCSGIRNRSSYVPLSRMDERTLHNDVSFLTDVERLSGASKRDPIMKDQKGDTIVLPSTAAAAAAVSDRNKRGPATPASLEPSTTSLFSCTPGHLDAASYTLMAACTQYRNIKLMCMPHGMKLHTENASRVYALGSSKAASNHKSSSVSLTPSNSVIRWTLHLLFKGHALTKDGPNTDLKIVKKRVDERVTWTQVLDAILQTPPVNTAAQVASEKEQKKANKKASKQLTDKPSVASISTALLRHQLAGFYPRQESNSANGENVEMKTEASPASPHPYSHLRLLYPVPFQPSNAPRFYSLRLHQSLLHSLAFKVLIEHPIVWIVREEDLGKYVLEQEPGAPGAGPKGLAENEREPRKKRKTEGTTDGATPQSMDAGASFTATSGSSAVAATPADASAPSSRGRGGHARGGHSHRGGFPRGGSSNYSHAHSNHSRGGHASHASHSGGGFRGRGRGGSWQDRSHGGHQQQQPAGGAPATFSFGVVKPPEPAPKPATPSLFKRWG